MVNIGKPFQRDGRSRKWEAEGTRRYEGGGRVFYRALDRWQDVFVLRRRSCAVAPWSQQSGCALAESLYNIYGRGDWPGLKLQIPLSVPVDEKFRKNLEFGALFP